MCRYLNFSAEDKNNDFMIKKSLWQFINFNVVFSFNKKIIAAVF